MSLNILNIVFTLGFIGLTIAGVYTVWQSFQIDIHGDKTNKH
jgi:hypothetical protein